MAKSKADVSASIVKTSTSVLLEAPVAVASCSAAATAVSSLMSTPVSFTPGAPGWCSVSSASCSYYSSTVGAVGTTPVGGLYGDQMMLVGHGCSAVTPPQNSTSTGAEGSGDVDDAETSSSFGLIGDELGEFGIDGPDSGIPGSGFAPGGYWHQMVKEESTMARESDDGGDMDDDDERDNGDDENNDRPLEEFSDARVTEVRTPTVASFGGGSGGGFVVGSRVESNRVLASALSLDTGEDEDMTDAGEDADTARMWSAIGGHASIASGGCGGHAGSVDARMIKVDPSSMGHHSNH